MGMHLNKFRVLVKFKKNYESKSIQFQSNRIPKSRPYYVQLSPPIAQNRMGQGFQQRYKLTPATFQHRWIHGCSKDHGDGIHKELSEIKVYLDKTKCSETKYEFLLALREHNVELYYRYFCQNPSQVVSILRYGRGLDDQHKDLNATVETELPHTPALDLSKLPGQQRIPTESSMDILGISPQTLSDVRMNNSILGKTTMLENVFEKRESRLLHLQYCKEVYKYGRINRNLYINRKTR